MIDTKPYNSRIEFCKGVAVSNIFLRDSIADLIIFDILLVGLYTLRRRWASSIITKSQSVCFMYGALALANWYEQITILSAVNGLRLPISRKASKLRFSRIVDSNANFSCSSLDHCLRRLAGQIISNLRLCSAQCCDKIIPASMVLPKPTSSAKIAPFDKGDLNANRAASTWWGVKSTCASCKEAVSLLISLAGKRLVR